jgi:hypothetical protein
MERVEAVYDAGCEACVEFLVELTARYERQVTRLKRRGSSAWRRAGISLRGAARGVKDAPVLTASAREPNSFAGLRRRAGITGVGWG